MRTVWRAIVTVLALVVLAQAPAGRADEPAMPLREFSTLPQVAQLPFLLGNPAVQQELALSTERKQEIEKVLRGFSAKLQQLRRQNTEQEKFLAARAALFTEIPDEILKALEPKQRERVLQIQLQARGPLAFDKSSLNEIARGGPDLVEQLRLSDEQAARVRSLARAGFAEMTKAGAVPIVLDPKRGDPTLDSVRELVATPEFRELKQKTVAAARKTRAEVIERIEQVLTEPQRAAYHEMLGQPYDLAQILGGRDEVADDAQMAAFALNLGGGGQEADPKFDTKVANPAYATNHPRVLFDEAHHNFHTSTGRYKPFAKLIANDGYEVVPNKQKFTKEVLGKAELLVIANALGGEGMGAPTAADSAFTDAECVAVRDWVEQGGGLLFITDHAPFGSAAESLAKRLGVHMSKGFTTDAANSQDGDSCLVFSRQNGLLGDHPITQGRDDKERIGKIQTFTGQSLRGPLGSVAILRLAGSAQDQGENGELTSAAGRAQGIAFTLGKGRVVVMGEAAQLSAQVAGGEPFGMNIKGIDNRQMALNVMHWLSGLLEPRKTP